MNGQLYTEEEVKAIVAKSVKKYKAKVKKQWKNTFISLTLLASAIVICINLSYSAISNKFDENKKTEIVNEYGTEIATILNEDKGFNPDSKASKINVWYDTQDAAEYIKEDNDSFDIKISDFDVKLFLAYNKVIQTSSFDDAAIRNTMNSLISRLSSEGEYASFEDYVVKLGFVDKENKADYERYNNEMRDLINKIKSVQDTVKAHNLDETESVSDLGEGQNPGGRK